MSTFSYTPLPTARRIHKMLPPGGEDVELDWERRDELLAIVGPWGSGKSTIAAVDLYLHCRYYHCDALVVRDNYPALRDSCVKQFMEIFGDAGELLAGPPPTFKWKGELAGREVMFRSAEDPRDVQKFGSVQVGFVWLEEVCPGISATGTINQGLPREIFAALFGRIRQKGARRRMILTSLPPPSQKHWFYQIFYERQEGGLSTEPSPSLRTALYHLPREENVRNLPAQYYESQLPLLSTADQINRFLLGKVGSAYPGFSVYPGWNDLFHVKLDLAPVPGPIIRGWDGGLSPACVWLQLTQAGRCLVLAELQGQDIGIEEFGQRVLQHGTVLFGVRHYQDFCDPSMLARSQNNGKSCRDYLAPLGINLRPAPQDPTVRIHAVRGWLTRMGVDGALFQVHRRCEGLIEGFRGGLHFKVFGGMATEQVEKNEFSHRHDALQYPLAYFSRAPTAVYAGPKHLPAPLGRFMPGQKEGTPAQRHHRIVLS